MKKADLIVIGTVTSMTCKWDKNKKDIYAYIAIKCDDWLKGKRLNKITIKSWGGEIGDKGISVSTAIDSIKAIVAKKKVKSE